MYVYANVYRFDPRSIIVCLANVCWDITIDSISIIVFSNTLYILPCLSHTKFRYNMCIYIKANVSDRS